MELSNTNAKCPSGSTSTCGPAHRRTPASLSNLSVVSSAPISSLMDQAIGVFASLRAFRSDLETLAFAWNVAR